MTSWDKWAQEAYSKLESSNLLNPLRPIWLDNPLHDLSDDDEPQVFDEIHPWDRATVEVKISDSTFHNWMRGTSTDSRNEDKHPKEFRNLILFSGNDYLGLSSHPSVKNIAAKAMVEHGMGPKGSAIVAAYTNHHSRLESYLADFRKTESCLVCPSGFAANTAVMVTLGNIASILAVSGTKPSENERIAIFSDALNHASIVDGISLAQRQRGVQVFVYRHSDMTHLDSLLSSCMLSKKVVVTDSLFSMDGDFAPMSELVKLRKKYGFLLILDDAHGTFVYGKKGGGVSEKFNCEKDVDITTATLSKAAGCIGGFITCSNTWKQLIQAKGRNFIFSTAIPVPIAAAARAAVIVGEKESWRRRAVWDRVRDFCDLTGIPVSSHIVSLVIGSPEKAVYASKHLLKCGFHVVAMKPPVVPAHLCRLRVSISAAHTRKDIEGLVAALSGCIDFNDYKKVNGSNGFNSRL